VIARKPAFEVEPLLTAAEVADLFKVHPLTVTRWANQGLRHSALAAPAAHSLATWCKPVRCHRRALVPKRYAELVHGPSGPIYVASVHPQSSQSPRFHQLWRIP
jgi:hypothetical protein